MKLRSWYFLIPTLAVLSITAFIPICVVFNYSLHSFLPGSSPLYVGFKNFRWLMTNPAFFHSLSRTFQFSFEVLAIELPLGIGIACLMPKEGKVVGVSLVALGIPLLIPWNVVGIIWRVFTRADTGILPALLAAIGYNYNLSIHPVDAWITTLIMDVWHWTPLIALLSYAGLRAIPDEPYQAAKIDGASRWAIFRNVTLPGLRHVLVIGVLLRLMDSFKMYSSGFVLTGGGPGATTTFLSIFTTRLAIGSFELGKAGAVSLVYFFIVLVLCFILYKLIMRV